MEELEQNLEEWAQLQGKTGGVGENGKKNSRSDSKSKYAELGAPSEEWGRRSHQVEPERVAGMSWRLGAPDPWTLCHTII